MISENGIAVDREMIKEIMENPIPKYIVYIRSFMGITDYYHRFIEEFSKITYPITSLQEKGNKIYLVSKMPRQF